MQSDTVIKNGVAGHILLFFFALFWLLLVGAFDTILTLGLVRQIASQNYPSVIGTITHSAVTSEQGDDDLQYGVDLQYTYEVNNHAYQGKRYRYNQGSSSDSGWAKEAATDFPVLSRVPVFYNPRDPADSVLTTELKGVDMFWILFLTPFNMISLGIIYRVVGSLRKNLMPQASFTRCEDILPHETTLCGQMSECTPLAAALLTTTAVAFLEILAIGIQYGFHPPLLIAMLALFVAYGAGLLAYARLWLKAISTPGHS